jgi:hypothetical protein
VRPFRNRVARFVAATALVAVLAIAFAVPAAAEDGAADGITSIDDGGVIGPFIAQ